MKKQTEGKYFGEPWRDIVMASRYNGGWIKSVTGIDRSKNNGYSLTGDFTGKSGDTYKVGELYLDCDIGGSRKRQVKTYTLFTVLKSGTVKVIAQVGDTRGWAIELWKPIEKFLGKPKETNPLAQYSVEELEAELKRRK